MPKPHVEYKYRYQVVEYYLPKGHPNRNMGELIWYRIYDKQTEKYGLGAYTSSLEAGRMCNKKNGVI